MMSVNTVTAKSVTQCHERISGRDCLGNPLINGPGLEAVFGTHVCVSTNSTVLAQQSLFTQKSIALLTRRITNNDVENKSVLL